MVSQCLTEINISNYNLQEIKRHELDMELMKHTTLSNSCKMLGGLWVNINKAHFTYRFLDDPDELYYTNGASFSIVEQECVDHQNKDNDAVLL